MATTDMAEKPTRMDIDRGPGKRIRVDLGDGIFGYISGRIRSGPMGPYITFALEFPRSVGIDREEVYLRKLAELQGSNNGNGATTTEPGDLPDVRHGGEPVRDIRTARRLLRAGRSSIQAANDSGQ